MTNTSLGTKKELLFLKKVLLHLRGLHLRGEDCIRISLAEYMCLRQSLADRTVSSVGRDPKETVFLLPPSDLRAGSLIIDLRRETSARLGLSSSKTSLLSSLPRVLILTTLMNYVSRADSQSTFGELRALLLTSVPPI